MADNSANAVYRRLLKHFRTFAHLTQDELADSMQYSKSQISAIETGREVMSRPFAEAADAALPSNGSLAAAFPPELPEDENGFDLPQYEDRSTIIRYYEHSVIPGLLQTPEYASVVLHGAPKPIERRLRRQILLDPSNEDAPVFSCVLRENVLNQLIGSTEIMRIQLEKLLEMMSDRVIVAIIPAGEPKPWIAGSFVLCTLLDNRQVAHAESSLTGQTVVRPGEVSYIAAAWELVKSQALPSSQSEQLIRKAIEEKWS